MHSTAGLGVGEARGATSPRGGFSFSEILVATFVFGVLLLPVMSMLLSSTGGTGLDVREVRATQLAQEIVEQAVAFERQVSEPQAIPAGNGRGEGPQLELDLDQEQQDHAFELGFPLVAGSALRSSRMYLSLSQHGFHRFLSIGFVRVGMPRGPFFAVPALLRICARVQYAAPLAGGVVSRDVRLYTYVATNDGLREEVQR